MSIANKLTYLEETKRLIREKLNDLGAEITDDTFREYVEKLEEIYRNYPKTTFRGSDITLLIAKKEKIEIFPIGNTTQNVGVSPDYPQPIKNVTGNNTVKITLENGEIIEKQLALKGDDYNYELAHTYTANQDWYDYIEGSKDNWKLIKQNKRLKITGSSGFGYYTDAGTDSRLYRARYLIPNTVGPTNFGYHYTNLVKCDKFGITKSNADITTKDIMQVAQNDGRIALFTYITKERLGITNSDTAAEKQQKYKDWFTQNQPEVIYPSTVIDEITITQPTLIKQLNELYSMMTTGKTITIKTESEEENAQLNLEIRTL